MSELVAKTQVLTEQQPSLTTVDYKDKCRQTFDALKQEALKSLILADWIVGEVERLRIAPSEGEVQKTYRARVRESFTTKAELERYLAESGESVADLIANVRVELASSRLYARIEGKAGRIGQAQVRKYYRAHPGQFAIKEQRDLNIVRTDTRSAALQAKVEIAEGASFGAVVKRVGVAQPIGASRGFAKGLTNGLYKEPPLNDAIFSARANVLSGPVHISLGYYVFKVRRIVPRRHKSFGEVSASLEKRLSTESQREDVARFVAAWRARWRSRTHCRPGFVVQQCSEFSGKRTAPESPYAFN